MLASQDEDDWDAKYGETGVLPYGSAAHQGPRDTMEDYVAIVPKARCGYLYAGTCVYACGINCRAMQTYIDKPCDYAAHAVHASYTQ